MLTARSIRKALSVFISLYACGFLAVLILVSCTETQVKPVASCRNTDWFEKGRADGVAGLPANEIESHRKICNSTAHPVDEDLYVNGRNVGLLEYCTPAVGIQRGKEALPYLNVCPSYLEPKFLNGYRLGGRIRLLEFQNVQVEKRMQELAQKMGRDLSTVLATPAQTPRLRPRDPAATAGAAQASGASAGSQTTTAQNSERRELDTLRKQHAEIDGEILDLENQEI